MVWVCTRSRLCSEVRWRNTQTGGLKNPKHQNPNFKQAPNTKSQYPNKGKSLSKVFCLEFGV
jgi:hypothetical protein